MPSPASAVPAASPAPTPFDLRGDHVTLEALLKASGLAPGGAAKALIAAGTVRVNGAPEIRRGRKLRGGDVVALDGAAVLVRAAPASGPA